MGENIAYRCGRWVGTTLRNLGYSYKIFMESQKNREFSEYLREQDGELHHLTDELKVHRMNAKHLKDLCTHLDSSVDWKEHGFWKSKLDEATRDVVHWTNQDDEMVYEIRQEKKLRKTLEQHHSEVPHEQLPEYIQEHLIAMAEEETKERAEAEKDSCYKPKV